MAKGYAAPEVERVYTRARELCRAVGRDSSALPGAVGTVGFYIVRAELKTARELAEQLLSLAQTCKIQLSF